MEWVSVNQSCPYDRINLLGEEREEREEWEEIEDKNRIEYNRVDYSRVE